MSDYISTCSNYVLQLFQVTSKLMGFLLYIYTRRFRNKSCNGFVKCVIFRLLIGDEPIRYFIRYNTALLILKWKETHFEHISTNEVLETQRWYDAFIFMNLDRINNDRKQYFQDIVANHSIIQHCSIA